MKIKKDVINVPVDPGTDLEKLQEKMQRLFKVSQSDGPKLGQIKFLLNIYEADLFSPKVFSWVFRYIILHTDGDITQEEKQHLWSIDAIARMSNDLLTNNKVTL